MKAIRSERDTSRQTLIQTSRNQKTRVESSPVINGEREIQHNEVSKGGGSFIKAEKDGSTSTLRYGVAILCDSSLYHVRVGGIG